MSVRTDRVAGEIKNAIARQFQNGFDDLTDGMITVTNVRMAPDLRSGRVYLSLLGGHIQPDEFLKRLRAVAPKLRSAVGQTVHLKFTPELFYYLDDTQEEVAKIEDILRKIREERRGVEPSEPSSELDPE